MDTRPIVTPPRGATRAVRHGGRDGAPPVLRVWMRGDATVAGRQPVRRFAADIARVAEEEKLELAGWEFAPAGTGGLEARTTVRWDDPRAGHVHAAVMLRQDAERTCEWAVAADCEHGWWYDVTSPCRMLGIHGADFRDPSGVLCLDEAELWSPEHDDEPDEIEEPLRIIADPARTVGLFVVSIGTESPRSASYGLFPGVVAMALITEEGRDALNRRLPRQPIPACGARYFPAPCDPSMSEHRLGTSHASRSATYQRLVDEALTARAATAPAGLAAATVALLPRPPGGDDPAGGDLARLRERVRRLEDDLARARERQTATRQALQRAECRREAAATRADRLAADLDEARARLDDPALERQLAEALTDRDVYAQALEIAEEERDVAVRERGLLAIRLARAESAARPSARPARSRAPAEEVPADFGALLTAAATRFPLLLLDDLDPAGTTALDAYPKAQVWRRRTWDALATLDAYARARREAHTADRREPVPHLADVHAFIRAGRPGALISANIVALGESENVNADPRYRNARMFTVRPETHPTGRAFFAAHIKIDGPRPPAPRLHFYDDTCGPTGRVYVGHIGPHLPTSRTN
ncbi:hypothetical protein BTM25_20540 [Actinomadura rubteroloni]|uniref:Uncharacterized protein n=1 Tax=Actinomadura rubteroloni TaxID=1926885 RepID=A0A2P4URG4_9ACTN|nr:hypothetical protein [Actinomadura rubteroloni]POM27638.1 hypothetical protein BTM25_20540 [Actinomadura rubteroloni]